MLLPPDELMYERAQGLRCWNENFDAGRAGLQRDRLWNCLELADQRPEMLSERLARRRHEARRVPEEMMRLPLRNGGIVQRQPLRPGSPDVGRTYSEIVFGKNRAGRREGARLADNAT